MTTVISGAEAMPNSTAFSYAQAAKRHTPLESTTAATSVSPLPNAQSKDDAVSTSTTSATILTAQSTTSEISESVKSVSTDPEVAMQKQDSEVTSVGDSVSSATPTPAPSTTATRDGEAAGSEFQAASGDKQARSSNREHRSTDSSDSKKGRKGKKGRTSDKDAESDQSPEKEAPKEPVKVALLEAPIPTVNYWQQRAAAAKTKVPATATAASASSAEPAVGSASQETKAPEAKKKEDAESQTGAKPQRRSGDAPRPGSDQASRRSGPRGSKLYEKDGSQAKENLPPVADASLWPTPETAAVEDERRKTQVKPERSDKDSQEEAAPAPAPAPAKPGKKKEWVSVPFVPTVTFNTQIQQRPSRPRGGGRVGRDTGRAGHSATPSTAGEKSPTAAGSAVSRPAGERDPSAAPSRANSLPGQSTKRASMDTTAAQGQRKPSAPGAGDRATGFQPDASASAAKDKRHSYSQGLDHHATQRHDQTLSKEGFKEQGTRPGRGGRGGYRGDRNAQHNGNQGHMQAYGPGGQRYQGSISPPVNQNVFAPPFVPKGAGRDPRHRHSLPTLSGHYPRAGSNGPGKMHPIQTGMEYNYPVHPYSAYPYTPYYNPQIVHVLLLQVEYYLSVENLCKDMFLRKQMDSQGFVPFELIANFKRMLELAEDVNMVRFACEESERLDYVTGDDSVERLRLRDGWQNFVLPLAERDPHARVPGPNNFWFRSKHSRPAYQAPMVAPGYPAASPTMYPPNFPPNEMEHMYHGYPNGGEFHPGMNGGEMNGGAYPGETPLSAAVPEFAPSAVNGGSLKLEDATTFTDKEASNLVMVFGNGNGQAEPAEALAESSEPAAANGPPNGTEEATSREASTVRDGALSSPPPSSLGRVMSRSDGTRALVSDTNLEGKYPTIRARVLEQRQQASPGEVPRGMKELYDFWSHFLLEQFNPGMYEDFRGLALEDASWSTPNTYGLNKLLGYYEEVVANGKGRIWGPKHAYPEVFDAHFEEARSRVDASGSGEAQQ